MNLVGEMSFPIAERLLKEGVSFVFATGYGDNGVIPREFKKVKIVTKPYEEIDVVAALTGGKSEAPA